MSVSKPKSTQYERLRQYANSRELELREVEVMCGLPYRSLTSLNVTKLSSQHYVSIAAVFPNLNMRWLSDGVGEMLNKGVSDEIGYYETPRIRLISFIRHVGITIQSFESKCNLPCGFVLRLGMNIPKRKLELIGYRYQELNTNWLATGEGTMLKDGTVATKQEIMMSVPNIMLKHASAIKDTEQKEQESHVEIERNFYKAEVERLTKELADARTTILALTDTIKKLNEK